MITSWPAHARVSISIANLLVDLVRDLVAVVPLLADLAAEEDQFFLLAERERTERLAHAELGHHPARDRGRALDVVAAPVDCSSKTIDSATARP